MPYKKQVPPGHQVVHISDVEGDLSYLQRWVYNTDGIFFVKNIAGKDELIIRSNITFVFGGDAVNGGTRDLEVLRILTTAKKQYPNQVFLLAGNRDIIKTRFTQELTKQHIIKASQQEIPNDWLNSKKENSTYWWGTQKNKEQLSFYAYITEQSINLYNINETNETQAKILYLKWMLSTTMGCTQTFEFRRQELAKQNDCELNNITDTQVLESFEDSVQPGGLMYEYLTMSDILVQVNDTLFVHGAVNPASLILNGRKYDNVHEWLNDYYIWYKQAITSWTKSPFNKNLPEPGTDPLNAIAFTHAVNNGETIVYTSWPDDGPSIEIERLLATQGIFRVVSGHQPFANSSYPASQQKSMQVIINDTRYSNSDIVGRSSTAFNSLTIEYGLVSSIARMHVLTHEGINNIYDYLPIKPNTLVTNKIHQTVGYFIGKKHTYRSKQYLIIGYDANKQSFILQRKADYNPFIIETVFLPKNELGLVSSILDNLYVAENTTIINTAYVSKFINYINNLKPGDILAINLDNCAIALTRKVGDEQWGINHRKTCQNTDKPSMDITAAGTKDYLLVAAYSNAKISEPLLFNAIKSAQDRKIHVLAITSRYAEQQIAATKRQLEGAGLSFNIGIFADQKITIENNPKYVLNEGVLYTSCGNKGEAFIRCIAFLQKMFTKNLQDTTLAFIDNRPNHIETMHHATANLFKHFIGIRYGHYDLTVSETLEYEQIAKQQFNWIQTRLAPDLIKFGDAVLTIDESRAICIINRLKIQLRLTNSKLTTSQIKNMQQELQTNGFTWDESAIAENTRLQLAYTKKPLSESGELFPSNNETYNFIIWQEHFQHQFRNLLTPGYNTRPDTNTSISAKQSTFNCGCITDLYKIWQEKYYLKKPTQRHVPNKIRSRLN